MESEGALPDHHGKDIGEHEDTTAAPPLQTEEEKLRASVADWKDKYMRLVAEFDNYRKRNVKERIDLLASASGDVIKDLLPLLDDFERAIKANENLEDINVAKEGFDLIYKRLYRQLEGKGLKPIESTGKPFDVDYHEAVTNIPAANEDLKGKVVDTVEMGYTLHDKVIRFAKVVVGT
ncbi:MAG: nucleotide exchange factor GrpE [Crocinitomicaceae bacterium]|nr:nucleotide exchange factor GrpE [Crocinitomicaceae bacterium]